MYDDMISGMWKADPEWAAQADIDGMLLFIGPSEGFGVLSENRRGYLIMYANDQIIASKKLELTIHTGLTILPKTTVNYNIYVTDMSEPKDGDLPDADNDNFIPWTDIMPHDLEMELGVSSGKLILNGTDENGDKTEYAKLFKEPAATDLSRVMGEMGEE